MNDIDSSPLCPVCKINKVKYYSGVGNYYAATCSTKCSASRKEREIKRIKTCLERYGTEVPSQSEIIKRKTEASNIEKYGVKYPAVLENVKKAIKETTRMRYGVDSPLQREVLKNKIIDSTRKRYGVDCAFQSKELKAKIRETCIKKYGFESASKSEIVKKNVRESNIKKYGVENPRMLQISEKSLRCLKSKEWMVENHLVMRKSMADIAYELDVSPCTVKRYLVRHEIKRLRICNSSIFETQLFEFVKLLCPDAIRNAIKIISGNKELDVYVPSKNVAIEFDGLFWHSFGGEGKIEDKNKHLLKTVECCDRGIQLFHVFENEWLDEARRDIWKSIISSRLGFNEKIDAPECEAVNIDVNDTNNFLNEHHLHGKYEPGFNVGLVHDGELISLMVFNELNNREWELVRSCNKKFIDVVGTDLMMRYFINEHDPLSIIFRADRRYCNQNKNIEMRFVGSSDPDCFYFKFGNPYFQRGLEFEADSMFANGYRRIWDCGNMVFEWKKPV